MMLTCFTAYDIRGRLGAELNADVAYRIGHSFAQFLNAGRVVVGCDVRRSSEALKEALTRGLIDAGADVIDVGVCGTEEVYFAAFHLDVDGGIEITASHNPIDYNGMKLVGRNAAPISQDSGLLVIKELAESGRFPLAQNKGRLTFQSILAPYVDHLFSFVDATSFRPMKLLVNAGNGTAGHVIDEIEARFAQMNVPVSFIKLQHEPDGTFPHGIPNPLLPEKRIATSEAVKVHQADMGIAWDGDFDRCFLFDEYGAFIEGYYIVGLLAEMFLAHHPGAKIVHDPRLTWNTIDIVRRAGGIPVQSRTGHAFIKERMRAENAVYGGEMSAHHYFRDFAYCDSGMIPWLLVAHLISTKQSSLSTLVAKRLQMFPCSGEINYVVDDPHSLISRIEAYFAPGATEVDKTDGLSMGFSDWRFNLRSSNTEPLLRLNIESKNAPGLVADLKADFDRLIVSLAAVRS